MIPDSTDTQTTARRYIRVFVALLGLTGITVAVAELNVGVRVGIAIGVGIATVKAALVALVFMHLNHERRWVYGVLAFALISVVGLLFWPAWGDYDRPRF
jgi:cytochrome c oxidase subunit 4